MFLLRHVLPFAANIRGAYYHSYREIGNLFGNIALADALNSAIKLETKLADLHMESVANFADPSFKEMFGAMMKADKDHARALQEAYNTTLKLSHAAFSATTAAAGK